MNREIKRYILFDCYESRNRELKQNPLSECRWDERLKSKPEESMCLTYTG
jgi:hypothetical protein